jgi:hypothetical protein
MQAMNESAREEDMRIISALVIVAAFLIAPPSGAADLVAPVVVEPPSAVALACAEENALARIKKRFDWAERTQWHRGFTIDQIVNPRPSGHPFAEPGIVRRDFCAADTVMTDGNAYTVFYTIEYPLGFVGLGAGVDFCLPGLDPWHAHDGNCRTVR